MLLANSAQRQDEPRRGVFIVALIGVAHDTGVEQRRRLKRIFCAEIGPEQQATFFGQTSDAADHPVELNGPP